MLKVLVHKIFSRSSSEDDIAYAVDPRMVYCAAETDILPQEKSMYLMELNYCTKSSLAGTLAFRLTVWV